MGAAAFLIRPQEIGTYDCAILLGDEYFMIR